MRSAVRKRFLAVALAALVAYAGVAYVMARQVTRAERVAPEESPARYGLDYENVVFPARGGRVSLRGWYVAAAGGSRAAAVVFVHGIHVNRASDHALEIAARLQAAGYGVLLFDLRGHGESGGRTVSGGYFERQDLLGAVDLLRARGVPDGRIGVIGNSMGGAVAILAAALEPAIGAVVADSPYARAEDLVPQETARATGVPAWSVVPFVPGMRVAARLVFGIDLAALAPEAAAARLDLPLLLIHGTADTRVPAAHSERIRRASRNPRTVLWLVPGAGHVEAYEVAPEEYVARVLAYFERQLGGAGG